MKYRVNAFYGHERELNFHSVYPNDYVGLFKGGKWEGRGNFCGWYGAEFYQNTELIAYYTAEGTIYMPEKRISDVTRCNVALKEVAIGSCYWEYIIEADSDEEAIEKFKNAQWTR